MMSRRFLRRLVAPPIRLRPDAMTGSGVIIAAKFRQPKPSGEKRAQNNKAA
jgi:hypothetical protein